MNPTSATVDPRYSAPEGMSPEWSGIAARLTSTEVYALTTVLPDGSPHTVPVAGAWTDAGFMFCTGEQEQKARNIQGCDRVSVHVGSTLFMTGMDIVVRGHIVQMTDEASLKTLAVGLEGKYPESFRFQVTEGALLNPHGNRAIAFCVTPEVVHVFTRGENTVQARYDFTS